MHKLSRQAERLLGKRPQHLAFTEWLLGLLDSQPVLESDLRRAVSFHWKSRFDPIGLDPNEEGQFEELCHSLRERLRVARTGSGAA